MCRDRPQCVTGLMNGEPTVRFPYGGPLPSGCRWCGAEERGHAQRWVPSAGVHGWVEPTRQQRYLRLYRRVQALQKARKDLP